MGMFSVSIWVVAVTLEYTSVKIHHSILKIRVCKLCLNKVDNI